MINSIGLKNIRIFRENMTTFSLPELCVFCGTNSSGKSSILKSLLLIVQSQGINESTLSKNGYLRFVGSQVDLGRYSTFVSDRNAKKEISIALNIPFLEQKDNIIILYNLKKKKKPQLKEDYNKMNLNVIFTFKPIQTKDELINETHEEQQSFKGLFTQIDGILKTAKFKISKENTSLLEWSVTLKKQRKEYIYEIHMPKVYFEKVGGQKIMDIETSKDGKNVFSTVALDGLIPSMLLAPIRDKNAKKEKNVSIHSFPSPPHIERAFNILKSSLRNIHYIGPLRTPAKRYYITNLDITPTLDPAGKFLPYLLARKNEPEVSHVRPGETKRIKDKLSLALNIWVNYIKSGEIITEGEKITEEVVVSSHKGILVELGIKSPIDNAIHSLADSGFGYSQLLPILVRSLLAPPLSTIIIEQPELHLNPALQVRIAEFFIAMARARKQVIIETHSEHIVNSIRVVAAEDESGFLSKISKLFFLDTVDKQSEIHEISIRPNGTTPVWPYNFFGEAGSLSGRILRAQKRFREKIIKGEVI